MLTGPATSVTTVGQHLDAIATALTDGGVDCQVTRPAGTPVLTTGPPLGLNAATVAIDPDMHAATDLRMDCTCVWTPAPGTTPEVTAAVIGAVLNAICTSTDSGRRQPVPATRRGLPSSCHATRDGPSSGIRGMGCGALPRTTLAPVCMSRLPTPTP
jgi:hypothetical protein